MTKWSGRLWPGAEGPTLGFVVASWIEANCVIPDGPRQGEPYRLTNEMLRFLVRFYELKPDAEPSHDAKPYRYRGALIMRPQKWGKGPFAAAICIAEALGPVSFAGWDEHGEPFGVRRPTPLIQLVANSEEQTDNTWLSLHDMIEYGPLKAHPDIDLGITSVNIAGGGQLEPRTASGRARLGARLTFGLYDESGLMTVASGGVLLVTTMKRGAGGMGGRWLETSNAYDPSENSVAQRTHESAARDVLVDFRPPLAIPDLDDDKAALEALNYAYGDSYWVDRERVLADARDPAVCPSQSDAFRFFFNRITVGESDVIDPTKWDALKRERDLKPRQAITIGFDGSRSQDATSLVASRISDGRLFHLRTWNPADYENGRVPRFEVKAVVKDAFKAYDVRFLYGDPYLWQDVLEEWDAQYPKRIVLFPTNSEKRMDEAIGRFISAVDEGLTHDGDPILTAHLRAAALTRGARKQPRPGEDVSIVHHYLKVISKRRAGHIDALVAAILAEEARGKAVATGQVNRWRAL